MPSNDKALAWMTVMEVLDLSGYEQKIKDWCVQSRSLICSREVGNGKDTPYPHVHILTIYDEMISSQTIHNRAKKFFGDLSVNNFRNTVWKSYKEDRGLQQYVSKGPSDTEQTPPVILYHTEDMEYIMEDHNNWWIKHNQIEEERAANAKKITSAKKQQNASDILIKQIIEQLDKTHVPTHDGELFTQTCKHLLALRKGKTQDHFAFPIIQAVMYHYHPVDTANLFVERLHKKYFT